MPQVPNSIISKVNPDVILEAAPSFYTWARRTKSGKPSTYRQVRALSLFYPEAPGPLQQALGGSITYEWANLVKNEEQLEDQLIPDLQPNQIAVLALPYGGPNNGRDIHNQYFSEYTEFMDDAIPNPPVFMAHGTSNNLPPEIVGTVTRKWYDERGGWYIVDLDIESRHYNDILDAQKAKTLYASTGVVPASYKYNEDTGHIDIWLVGELSLVNIKDGFIPANKYAITTKCEVLFDDYYGEPVYSELDRIEGNMEIAALLEKISNWIDSKTEQKAEEKEEEKDMPIPEEEKCEACDEAARLAEEVKAEIATAQKCARCPEAINYVKTAFKAGKISPAEAFTYLETFTKSDETFDTMKEEIDSRSVIGANQKGIKLSLAGGSSVNSQETVDQEFLNTQRKLLGLPIKKGSE